MDLSLPEEYHCFREEVWGFHKSKRTASLRSAARLSTSAYPHAESSLAWHRIFPSQGWAAPRWPKEHRGTGWNPMQHQIYNEEVITHEAILATGTEAVGNMKALCGITVDHTKERKHFGVPIDSFQVLQHRMDDILIAYEESKSLLSMATLTAKEGGQVSSLRTKGESRKSRDKNRRTGSTVARWHRHHR